MKNVSFLIVTLGLIFIFMFAGCKNEPEPSLYNPNYVSGPQPVITAILPDSAVGAFAGFGEVTIDGKNFIADPAQNWVYFDKKQGTVISATTTQLKVIAPAVVSDSVKIKVAVKGSDKFSNTVGYKLMAAVESIYNFKPAEIPLRMACDNAYNIYFTMLENGDLADSIYILNYKTRIRKGFGPALKPYDALRIGPNNQLYALHGTRKKIYVYPEGGGSPTYFSVKNKIFDFDFGPQQNIWGAGKVNAIVRVKLDDKSIAKFDFPGVVTAVKIFGDDIYLATKRDTLHKIYKRHIVSADSLAPEEEYFDLAQVFDMKTIVDDQVVGMAFSQDGYLYLSCKDDAEAQNSPAVIMVSPGGSSYETLYPVLFSNERKNNSLVWGTDSGTNLFVSRTPIYDSSAKITAPAVILRVNTLRIGAAQYGRGD